MARAIIEGTQIVSVERRYYILLCTVLLFESTVEHSEFFMMTDGSVVWPIFSVSITVQYSTVQYRQSVRN